METYEKLRQSCEPPNGLIEVTAQAKAGFASGLYAFVSNDVHGFWLPPDSKDGHCNPQDFAFRVAERYSQLESLCNNELGSPIEYQLGACLLWACIDWRGFPSVDHLPGPQDHEKILGGIDECVYLTPQANIAGHRVDFLLWFKQGHTIKGVAVECDGHQWHEKTKEQASRDKARDRAILLAGYPVLRFSGSDIFKDAVACMADIQSALSQMLDYRDLMVQP